jgi:hypothetical protein
VPELTITEWAAKQGITRQGAWKRIKSGKVSLNQNGKIDVDEAQKQWESNKDAYQQQRGAKPVKGTVKKPTADEVDPHSLAAAQRAEAWLKVKEKKLRLDRAEGGLLPKDEVEQAWSTMISAARSRLLLLADKIAHRLAASSDIIECKTIVDRAIRDALSALSEDPTTIVSPTEESTSQPSA